MSSTAPAAGQALGGTSESLPVAVIGAGPIGLATAAHLTTRGLPFVVLEVGDQSASSIADWAHVRLFSPWRFNTDAAARSLLEAAAWTAPDPDHLPTGGELIDDYLAPLAAHPAIAPRLRLGVRATAIARQGYDKVRTAGRDHAPFVLRLSDGTELLASSVIDAAGTWRSPNPLGGNGLAAYGEAEARQAGRVFDGMPDVLGALRAQFAGKTVAVAGAGHSATGTLLALAELAEREPGTDVAWIVRAQSPNRAFGGEEADALPARGALGKRARALVQSGRVAVHTGFLIHEITDEAIISADGTKVAAEVIVNATGARPDFSYTSELRLDLDPVLGSTRALAPLIDPNHHSCGTVPPHGVDELAHPETGYYAVGAKSYGRAPTFLLATGYEQVRSVVAALAGDGEAARDVQLELPQTGVCSSSLAYGNAAEADGGCCGPSPTVIPTRDIKRGLATVAGDGLLSVPPVEAQASDKAGTCRG
jgi:thioredoxin reductase